MRRRLRHRRPSAQPPAVERFTSGCPFSRRLSPWSRTRTCTRRSAVVLQTTTLPIGCPTGMRKERDSNPLRHEASTDFESACQTQWPPFQVVVRKRRVRESNPQAVTGPPRSRRLGMPMPNPPSEGEGIEPPPVFTRPSLSKRVPYRSANLPDVNRAEGAGFEPALTVARPRRSRPAPFHSVTPPDCLAPARTPTPAANQRRRCFVLWDALPVRSTAERIRRIRPTRLHIGDRVGESYGVALGGSVHRFSVKLARRR